MIRTLFVEKKTGYDTVRRRKQAEDSIRHQKDFLKKDGVRTNPYDLQRQVRRLREMSD